MAEYDKTLERIRHALEGGNCGKAIHEMEIYLTAWPEQHTQEKLNSLLDDYKRMEAYWLQGVNDPQRELLYQQLLQQVYVLYANVRHYHRMKASPYLYSQYTRVRQVRQGWSLKDIRQELENFVSEIAIIQLEPEHTRQKKSETLYHQHQQQMNQLFEYVLTSRQWTASVGQQFSDMLLSPTVDSIDQQLIISAITLSLMGQFDMTKFKLLTDVYSLSNDETVRQRALIGWVLSIDNDVSKVYPEQETMIRQLVQSEEVCKELAELQTQLLYCLNVEKDSHTIQSEILPDLMKGDNLRFTKMGLVEQEEDPMEDILHPGATEERMEKLEASFQRMMNMQKQGTDIYFGGFAHMKSYPFFYDVSNWLVPFYIQHPDIKQYVDHNQGTRFLGKIMNSNLFCNSDKYSFVIAYQEVLKNMPENIRQLIQKNEASIEEFHWKDEDNMEVASLRQMYLMDLNRFFRLYPHRSELVNPFEKMAEDKTRCEFFSNLFFQDTPMDNYKHDVVRMMRKHHYPLMAERVVNSIPETLQDTEYFLWKEDYNAVLKKDPNNEKALAGAARQAFASGNYEEAGRYYDHLMELFPAKHRYMLNKAVCLIHQEQYTEAQNKLYQLNYEDPENDFVIRALAWSLTCDEKQEQADKFYQQLINRKHPAAEDYQNYGYCLWLQGETDQAAQQFRLYTKNLNNSIFHFDKAWLNKRGISDLDILMMEALIESE